MKKYLVVFVTLATLPLVSPSAWADEPHLQFVQGLRARGMADLALEYLQSKSKNPPPELASVLPLELAKTRLELASSKSEPAARLAEQNQARAEFELFIKNNPQHPFVAEANLEVARIVAIQGKAQLTRARQIEGATRAAEFARARGLFEQA